MKIDIIGIPMDFGAGRRGVDMGPSAIRYAGLQTGLQNLSHKVKDHGNLEVPILENCSEGDPRMKFLDCILPITKKLSGVVEDLMMHERFPLVLGGDHSISLGSIQGVRRSKNIGVIWLDAHADFNTPETSPSGNLHGMVLAALSGIGTHRLVEFGKNPPPSLAPDKIAIVGARDLDPGEKTLLKKHSVNVFSMSEIDRIGLHTVLEQAINVVSDGTEGIYFSLDMDVIDPLYAPGVGTPVQGGLTYREAHLACEILASSGLLVGMDVVEVNPILDHRNQTAQLAVELVLSAVGKMIW